MLTWSLPLLPLSLLLHEWIKTRGWWATTRVSLEYLLHVQVEMDTTTVHGRKKQQNHTSRTCLYNYLPLCMWLTWQTSVKCFQFPKAPSGSLAALHPYLCRLCVPCVHSLSMDVCAKLQFKCVELKCNIYLCAGERDKRNSHFEVNTSPVLGKE